MTPTAELNDAAPGTPPTPAAAPALEECSPIDPDELDFDSLELPILTDRCSDEELAALLAVDDGGEPP